MLIRRALERDFSLLADIEARADSVFEGLAGFEDYQSCANSSAQDYRDLPISKRIWLAENPDPIAFASSYDIDNVVFLAQLSVLPKAQQMGVGTLLLETLLSSARDRGKDGVILTTFIDVPWNAPFYEARGFKIIDTARLSPALKAKADIDAKEWEHFSRRCIMGRFF